MSNFLKRFMVSFTLIAALLALLPASMLAAEGDITYYYASNILNFSEVEVGQTINNTAILDSNVDEVYVLSVDNSSIPAPFALSSNNNLEIGAREVKNYLFTVTPTVPGLVTKRIDLVFLPQDGTGDTVKMAFEAKVTGKQSVQTNAVTPNPSSINFGTVYVGSNSTRSVTYKNNTDDKLVLVQTLGSCYSGVFTCSQGSSVSLGANSTVDIAYTYKPTTATYTSDGFIYSVRLAGTSTEIDTIKVGVSGTGKQNQTGTLIATPASTTFGDVYLNNTVSRIASITNTLSSTALVNVSLSGDNGFSSAVSSISVPANSSKSFTLRFKPTSVGSKTATVLLRKGGILFDTINLSGSGKAVVQTGTLIATPASTTFGDVYLNNTVSRIASITNTLSSTALVDVSLTGDNGFSSAVSSISVPANSSKSFTLRFKPTSVGSKTATVLLRKGGILFDTINLSGSGKAVVQTGTVTLSPYSVDFGDVDVTDGIGDTSDRTVTFSNTTNTAAYYSSSDCTGLRTGDTNWLVLGLKCFYSTNSSTETRVVVPANSSKSVTFAFNPLTEGTYNKTVSFTKQIGSTQAPTTLTAYATGKAVKNTTTGSVVLNKTFINFGNVDLNTQETEKVRITNNYNQSVTVTSEGCGGNPFDYFNDIICVVPSTTFTIPANSYVDRDILFMPAEEKTYSDTFRFRTNSVDSNRTYTVTATGRGVDDTPTQVAEDIIQDFDSEYVSQNTSYSNDQLEVEYRVTRNAYVTLKTYDREGRLLSYGFTDRYYSGTSSLRTQTYTVTYTSDDRVRPYRVVITARTANSPYQNDTDTDYVNATNGNDSDENLLTSFSGTLSENGSNDRVNISFKLSRNSDLTLGLYDNNNRLISTVFDDRYFNQTSGVVSYGFNVGRNLTNSQYRLKLSAETTGSPVQSDEDTVSVNFNGSGPLPPATGCESFADINPSSQFCAAVEYVVSEGIITGDYNNGVRVLRQNDPLTRAEAVTVMMRAIDAELNSNYPLAFYDVDDKQYYSNYLRKAVELGAIHGYPNGTFQPGKLMTRAEFYKGFLRAVKNADRANYFFNSDITRKPFDDTALTAENVWYLPYADWARRYFDRSQFALRNFGEYDLRGAQIPTGDFKPGEYITRGHIIELIHEMHLKNLAQF